MSLGYKATVHAVNKVINEYDFRLTVRQIYYRLVSPPFQLFSNSLRSYKNLIRILTKARERGDVDWTRIEDRRRHTSEGESGYDSVEDYLKSWANALDNLGLHYNRKRWTAQHKIVQVWVEKEALASLFEQATAPYGVVVFPTVGYSSLTMFMEALQQFQRTEKDIVILDYRDHDPSGVDMTRDVRDRLAKYAGILCYDDVAERLEIKRVALTIDQVRSLGLSPNPTKKADKRSPAYIAQYGDQCWELDAYPPDQLRQLIEDAIRGEIDLGAWDRVGEESASERAKLVAATKVADEKVRELIDTLQKAVEENINGI